MVEEVAPEEAAWVAEVVAEAAEGGGGGGGGGGGCGGGGSIGGGGGGGGGGPDIEIRNPSGSSTVPARDTRAP